MPPADNQPDFDSMSPEELMAWMETLAERQGATQGFTTDKRMEIAEVDESTVQVDEPGYVPYGMDPEKWKAMQEAEKAEKAAARAAAPRPAQPPAPQPEPLAPPPEETPVQAVAQGGQPDFDSMSPEELMAWMETLAERQGATQGFTTDKRMEIAEVDESTVQVDEPGYVPYGMDPEKWKAMQEAEKAEKAAARAAAPRPAQPPAPQPEPLAELPTLEEDLEETVVAEPAPDDAMSWLESLAADQQPSFEMDLSTLDTGLEAAGLESLAEATAASENDPLAWLESLAQGEDEELVGLSVDADEEEDYEDESLAASAAIPTGRVADPIETGEDPVAWLESLARRQGVSDDELVTAADLDIPFPEDVTEAESGPGYTEFSFEAEPAAAAMPVLEDFMSSDEEEFDPSSLDDPEAWLESLATGQGFEAPSREEAAPAASAEADEVLSALNRGEDVSSEEMLAWMNRQFDRAAQIGDEEEEEYDPDAPPVKAEIPDWLLEQMGTPPAIGIDEEPEAAPAEVEEEAAPTFVEEMEEPAMEMPDWLSVDEPEDMGIESIFAAERAEEPEAELARPQTTTEELSMDSDDPWVIAFEQERTEGMMDIHQVPGWYAARLEGREVEEEPAAPQPVAVPSFEPAPQAPAAGLQPAALGPELELAEGEAEALPDWLSAMGEVQEVEAVPGELPDWLKDEVAGEALPSEDLEMPAIFVDESEELPDWLKEAELEPAELPDWLRDTLSTDEQEAVAVPEPTPSAPVQQPVSPAPVPVAAAQIDVAATLQDARSKVSAGDVDGGLISYEAVIRANTELETVVTELTRLTNDAKHKENPAIYRVLGDGLMRQGKLQAALDTYRKALNLL